MSKDKRVSRNKSYLAGTKFLTTNPATKIKSIPSRRVQGNGRKINIFLTNQGTLVTTMTDCEAVINVLYDYDC